MSLISTIFSILRLTYILIRHFFKLRRKNAISTNGTSSVYGVSPASASSYRAFSCRRPNVVNLTQHFVLDADIPRGPHNEFCRVIGPGHVTGPTYTVGVRFFNYDWWNSNVSRGSAGVMYNVVDKDNFDFVLFR